METMLAGFMAGLAEAGNFSRGVAENTAKQETLKREQELKQWERDKARYEEQRRVDELLANAEAWHKSEKLRAYINAYMELVKKAVKMAGTKIHPKSEIGRWETWAKQQADRLDPLVKSPPSILDDEPDTLPWRWSQGSSQD